MTTQVSIRNDGPNPVRVEIGATTHNLNTGESVSVHIYGLTGVTINDSTSATATFTAPNGNYAGNPQVDVIDTGNGNLLISAYGDLEFTTDCM